MASEPPKQKRKRGRPPGASNPEEDASGRGPDKAQRRSKKANQPGPEDEDAEEVARPRKRGRPSLDHRSATRAVGASEKEQRKRGRPPASKVDEENVEHGDEKPRQSTKNTQKRGRPLKASVGTGNKMRKVATRQAATEKAEVEEEPSSSSLRRSTRERRSWNAEEVFSAKIPSNAPEVETAEVLPNPRRRARISTEGTGEDDAAERAETLSTKFTKKRRKPTSIGENEPVKRRGRPSVIEVPEATEEEPSQPPRRRRPRTSDASQQEGETSEGQKASRRRPRRSSGDESQSSKPKARKPRPNQPEPADEEEEPAPAYRHLASETRKISRKTISFKWTPLNPPAIAAITTLLADAQRPVLLRLQDTGQRREAASAALTIVSRRLRSKLVKGMPFPPPTTTTAANRTAVEDDFDFERTVDGIQALENTLNPLLHSVTLLEREKEKEEAALKKDFAALNTLEANARSEARSWRERGKREHPLAPGVKKAEEADHADEKPLELVKSAGVGNGSVFQDLQDEELVSISQQIGNHMDSMKGNLQQIDGIIPAITMSKAALQRIIHENFNAQQYEQVLLG